MIQLLLSLALFVCALVSLTAQPRNPPPLDASFASVLNFENQKTAGPLAGWGGMPGTIFADDAVTHGGKWAARIERTAESKNEASPMTRGAPLAVTGTRIELRGYLRTDDVSGRAALWIRVDGEGGSMLGLDNMGRQPPVTGTTGWTAYSVSLPLNPTGRNVAFGALLSGTGKAWVDDLELLVDGKPIWEAPTRTLETSILDRDHEFDAGSKIALTELTPAQIGQLAKLGKIWGFLKYHHPVVIAGERHWDFELFRVMPAVLGAADDAAVNAALLEWIDKLGPVPDTAGEKSQRPEVHFTSDYAWLKDEAALGTALSQRLQAVLAAHGGWKPQFYLKLAGNAGNPSFEHELSYARIRSADAGYQLLALFRFWNIIQYWFPYRNLLEEDWHAVLAEFIPRVGLAADPSAYKLQMIGLIARVHDTHANLWGSLDVLPPMGQGTLPAVFRFIENRPVITQTISAGEERAGGLKRGDVLVAIDGKPVLDAVKEWAPFYAASNEPTRLRDIARNVGRGPVGPVKLQIERGGEKLELESARIPAKDFPSNLGRIHDLPGEPFRLLSKDVAYLKLSAVKIADVARYVEEAAGTKGWIIDIRNYPSEFVVFALGEHFVTEPTEFARFTTPSLDRPGEFAFGRPLALKPSTPHYGGRIVILVDEVSQSQAEYTTMAFRVAPGAIVIGSTTAAADGNVSRIPLPGGVSSMISGLGVFYPDRRQTQRVGIIPDLEVKPTLAGIREGRDELVEAALRQILGADTPTEELRRLSMPRE